MEIKGLKKYFGDRLILDIPRLTIYEGDKIGIIGLNGAGKTTLLDIVAGVQPMDEGMVTCYGSWEYITQLGVERLETPIEDYLSGGEKTLAKISAAFDNEVCLVMADEPTSNLSVSHVDELIRRLKLFRGALLLISHDRALLNEVCNKIIEIEDGRIKEYTGNYDLYKKEKEWEERRKQQDYEQYVKEKERLTETVREVKQKASSMKRAPSRMGNSEARLHKNSIKEKAQKVARTSKVIESRLNMLEEVKKPMSVTRTKIDIQEGTRLYSKIAVEAVNIEKRFGRRVLFQAASFQIVNGSTTALIGENGTGKTTLVKMIMEGEERIRKAPGLKAAYFSQNLEILDESKSIYDNVAEESAMSQTQIRNVLSRMLFFREDVFKPVKVLSGGERVKVALAKIFCKDVNMLILDEPNNYLDIFSMEALEGLIRDYEGTALLVTHDKSLIELADHLLMIEDKNVINYQGSYLEYKEGQKKSVSQNNSNVILQMENRLAEVIGRLSAPRKDDNMEALNDEFKRLSGEIRAMKGGGKNEGVSFH